MTSKPSLGRLEKITPRDWWSNEATEFTPWLAQEENLALLGEAIDMDLEHEATEESVGRFRADILCKNTIDDSWVLIENQIGRTDHDHLGKLITYASGLKAVTIVWIAQPFTEEHRAALDWLNEITGDKFNFFGLEIELWKIGDSVPAPKFNIISKPNNWANTVSHAAEKISEQAMTETKKAYLEFWEGFNEFLYQNKSKLKGRKPAPWQYMIFGVGRTSIWTAALLNTREQKIGVELVTTEPAYYHLLKQQSSDIEKDIGCKLVWVETEKRKKAQVYLSNSDPLDKRRWLEYQNWLKNTLENFNKAFEPRIRSLNTDDWSQENFE